LPLKQHEEDEGKTYQRDMKKYLKNSFTAMIIVLVNIGSFQTGSAQRVIVTSRPHTVVVTKHPPRTVRVYHSGPRYGYVVTKVPGRATVIRYGGVSYHCHGGVFYVQRPAGFVVVNPAFGLRISVLPRGYSRIVVSGSPYFYFYGVFYRPAPGTGGYVVVRPPAGIIVHAIPEGYKTEYINGAEYLTINNTYYQRVTTDLYENGVGYRVAELTQKQ
jgi:hypothetical protein